MKSTWCEIDTNAIKNNISIAKSSTNKKIIAVLKANAYGLGIQKLSSFLEEYVDMFAVSSIEEASLINSNKNILILTPVITEKDLPYIKSNYIFSVDCKDNLIILNKLEKEIKVHIFLNTGMNRFGLNPSSLKDFLEISKSFKNIKIHGIFTHLNDVNNKTYTKKQIDIFEKSILSTDQQIQCIHILNSEGFMDYNSYTKIDNYVRLGNLVYGFGGIANGYKKCYKILSKPIKVYYIDKGNYIGYNRMFKTKRTTKIGILDCGFSDKFGISIENKRNIFFDILKVFYHHIKNPSFVKYKGKNVPIIGNTNMNYTLIDITDIEDNSIFEIKISPLLLDSSFKRIYL